jgi:hypothetical protein
VRNVAQRVAGLLRADGPFERGAVGVLVAILLGSGVLLGMGALVVDVGQIYVEHSELVNGADAAALAVAKSCATGGCLPDIAPSYALANASHRGPSGIVNISLVCGSGSLAPCPEDGTPPNCAAPANGSSYVDVFASTPDTGHSALLPPVFASTLPGIRRLANRDITVCAQASWGAPAAAEASSLTISACSWRSATGDGTSFGPNPVAGLPIPSIDFAFHLLSHGGSGCQGGSVFGWAADQTGSCALSVAGPSYSGGAGGAPGSCAQVLATAQANRTPIVIPIFTRLLTTSGARQYRLDGFASFVVTGYHLPGASALDWLNAANNCIGIAACVDGYFTQGLVPTTGTLGGPDLGATVIELTG